MPHVPMNLPELEQLYAEALADFRICEEDYRKAREAQRNAQKWLNVLDDLRKAVTEVADYRPNPPGVLE